MLLQLTNNFAKNLIRVVAIYLWWFLIVFILAINSSKISWLTEGTHWGDALLRRPYAWDFELMFVVLFIVWGIFLWLPALPHLLL